jgi:NADP-dependent 3-hydroxy acid dehydrogenase YdfG
MMLKNKVAVIYGAGGAIGGAVARAFAREGAKLFLTGRHRAPVEAVAKEVASAAETAEVDALEAAGAAAAGLRRCHRFHPPSAGFVGRG